MERIVFKKAQQYNPSKSEIKGFNVFIGEIRRKAKAAGKRKTCAICNTPCSSFCNSHSIPQFVLNEIATEGRVIRGCDIIGNKPKNIKPVGVGKTWTFSSICNNCDSTFFREYETPNVLDKPLSSLEINEIAIKNFLKYIDKRTKDYHTFKILLEKMKDDGFYDAHLQQEFSNKLFLAEMDVKEYNDSIRQIIRKKEDSLFYVIDEINLDYNTQFAYQGFVSLICGFDDQIINDTFNYDSKYKIQRLGIAVFPYKQKTKIVLFCKNGDTRLRTFYKPYKNLSLEEKLYVINYILLLYEEEWCVPGSFDVRKINRETLDLVSQIQDAEIQTTNPFITETDAHNLIKNNLSKKYKLFTQGNIFNFLTKH